MATMKAENYIDTGILNIDILDNIINQLFKNFDLKGINELCNISKSVNNLIVDNIKEYCVPDILSYVISKNLKHLFLLLIKGKLINEDTEIEYSDFRKNSFKLPFVLIKLKKNELLDIYLKMGLNPNLIRDRETLLFCSCIWNNKEAAELLLLRGADPYINCCGKIFSTTPLISSVRFCHYDIVKLMLEFGVDPNHTNYNGYTALHFTTLTREYDITELLLEYGADPFIRDLDAGETPYEIAHRNYFGEIIELFDEYS